VIITPLVKRGETDRQQVQNPNRRYPGRYPGIQVLLPPLMSTINPYHRRRPHERMAPYARTDAYYNSFFPSTTRLWNNSNESFYSLITINELKRFFTTSDCITPRHYYFGNRKEQILHTRLRCNMSNLNFDLVQRHLALSMSCQCGFYKESAEHFLLFCPLFTKIRKLTIDKLPQNCKTITIMLSGSLDLTPELNAEIFNKVQNFIALSNRF